MKNYPNTHTHNAVCNNMISLRNRMSDKSQTEKNIYDLISFIESSKQAQLIYGVTNQGSVYHWRAVNGRGH